MAKMLVVDGMNLTCQMFFGMPARIFGKDGKPVHGIIGFVGALLKMIRMTEPTHVLVVFDGENGSDRHTIDADYKANRPGFSNVPEEEAPFSQLPGIYKALTYMGIAHFETDGVEADDVIAAYAKMFGASMKIVIASNDTDFQQLVTDNVSQLVYRGKSTVVYGPEEVLARYGVTPTTYADYKALVGDVSDNIKGVPRVGPKTAARLLREFGSARGLLADTSRITPPHVREVIEGHTDKLLRNIRLIVLTGETAIPFGIVETKFALDEGKTATMKILRDIDVLA